MKKKAAPNPPFGHLHAVGPAPSPLGHRVRAPSAHGAAALLPPAKRVRGNYALPVLAGREIAGHVEPRADRKRRKLLVVSRRVRRSVTLTPALDAMARWLELTRK